MFMFRPFKTSAAYVMSIVLASSVVLGTLAVPAYAQTQFQAESERERIAYLYGQLTLLLAQLQMLQQLQVQQQQSAPPVVSTSPNSQFVNQRNPYFVQVTSLSPLSVERTKATLVGEFDKGGSDVIETWFQYGTGNVLSRSTSPITQTQVGKRVSSQVISDLSPGTTYVYRAMAEDKNGNRLAGDVRTFATVATAATLTFTGRPIAETDGIAAVKSTAATLKGFVSMNDYETGRVFFVYGTSRRLIQEAENATSFEGISVVKGERNKRVANAKFSGRTTVNLNVSGLNRATVQYYRVCVDYSVRSEVTMRCGKVESFVTLN